MWNEEQVDGKKIIAGFICTLGVAILIVLGIYVSALFYVLALLLLIITIGVFNYATGNEINDIEWQRIQIAERREEEEREKKREAEGEKTSFLDVIWENIDSNLSEFEEFLCGDIKKEE